MIKFICHLLCISLLLVINVFAQYGIFCS
uniref:Uncharacterized protein n=1 Tax=Anguilla anguilla TaxID=7936 RepID=A0A0E9VLQ2_ANGAN